MTISHSIHVTRPCKFSQVASKLRCTHLLLVTPSSTLSESFSLLHVNVTQSHDSSGSIVNTTAVAPTLWTDSFLPNAAIEPVLPDPQKPQEPVGFKEVFATNSQVLGAAIKAL